MNKCGFTAQGKVCALDADHVYDDWFRDIDGSRLVMHRDATGFRFIDERWPDHMGNGPNRYSMNNPGFDKAVAQTLEKRKGDATKAEDFLKRLRFELAKR